MRRVFTSVSAIFLIITACSSSSEPQPQAELPRIENPTTEEVERVISKFLEQQKPVPVRLWVMVNGEIVARLEGTADGEKWDFAGEHKHEPNIRLAGRPDQVEWKTNGASERHEKNVYALYSPHEHLAHLSQSFNGIRRLPGNRFETPWTIVQVSLKEEKLKQSVQAMAGEQLMTPAVSDEVAKKMDVRYTLWYNESSFELQQMKMELFKMGEENPQTVQSLTYLFGEPAMK